jgi:hypothetical protein
MVQSNRVILYLVGPVDEGVKAVIQRKIGESLGASVVKGMGFDQK